MKGTLALFSNARALSPGIMEKPPRQQKNLKTVLGASPRGASELALSFGDNWAYLGRILTDEEKKNLCDRTTKCPLSQSRGAKSRGRSPQRDKESPNQALWWPVQREPPFELPENSAHSWRVGRGSHITLSCPGCALHGFLS